MRGKTLVSGLLWSSLVAWVGCNQGVVTTYTGSSSGAGGGGTGGKGSGGASTSSGVSSAGGASASSGSAATSSGGGATTSTSVAASSSSGGPVLPGTPLWAQDDGTPQGDIGYAIAVDPTGNVVVGGMSGGAFSGVNIFSGAALVRKRTGDGAPVWSKAFAATGSGPYAVVRAITTDPAGHVIAVGEFVGTINFGGGAHTSPGVAIDAFVVALDAAGNHLWSHTWGDSQSQACAGVATDAAGNVFVTGSMSGTVDFGGGPLVTVGGTDAFLVKLSPTGQHLWSKRYGDAAPQIGTAVATTVAGDVVLLGEFSGVLDLGGGPLTAMGVSPNSDVFVAKLSGADGAEVWAKRFGDGQSQQGTALAVDPQGAVAIAGQIRGSIDFGGGPLTNADPSMATTDAYVAKLDATGGYVWAQRFGDTAIQVATGVAMDAAGDVAVVGLFKGSIGFGGATFADPSTGSFDAFVAKLGSASGAHRWSYQVGDASDQRGRAVAMDGPGDVFLTGTYQGTIALAPGVSITSPGSDVFTIKISP
jgi:hypothetical protein